MHVSNSFAVLTNHEVPAEHSSPHHVPFEPGGLPSEQPASVHAETLQAQVLGNDLQALMDYIMSDAPANSCDSVQSSPVVRKARVLKPKLQFDSFEFARINQSLPRALTVDVTADSGSSLLPSHGSVTDPSAVDLAGQACWIQPDFDKSSMLSMLQHYFQCKSLDPTNTSACFVVPEFLRNEFPIFKTMTLLKSYAKGAKLFTAPPLPGQDTRRCIKPFNWQCFVFYDAPAPPPVSKPAVESHPLMIDDDGQLSTVLRLNKGEGFVVPGYVGPDKAPLSALIDSGATGLFCNYIDRQFLDKAGIAYTVSDASITGISGEKVPCYGRVSLSLSLVTSSKSGRPFVFTDSFLVIDMYFGLQLVA